MEKIAEFSSRFVLFKSDEYFKLDSWASQPI